MGKADNNVDSYGAPSAASLRQLFMFASFKDKVLIALGLLCAIIYGLRMFMISFIIWPLFRSLAHFDMTLSYARLQTMRNDTADLELFGTTSLNVIFADIFHRYLLGASIVLVILCLSYYGMLTTLDAATRHQVTEAFSLYLKALMRQDMAWFDGNQTGKVVSQTTDDFQKFEDAINIKLGLLTASISGYVVPVFFFLTVDWRLTLVCISFLPLYTAIVKGLIWTRTLYSKEESNEHAKAGSIAEEVLSGVKTVFSFGAETTEVNRYVSHLKKVTKAGVMKAIFASIFMALFYFTFCLSNVISVYFAHYLFENHLHSGPDEKVISSLGMIMFCMNGSGFRLNEDFGLVDAMSQGKSSFGRILSLINQKPTISSIEDHSVVLHRKIENVVFKNVSFLYPSRPDLKILDHFNMEVKAGEKVAVIGESGSGKSTLVSLLLRFYDCSEGSILLNDTDIRVLSPDWLRRQIGLVGQEPVLFPTTIAENIAYGRRGVNQEDVEKAARLANAHDFIQQLPQNYETIVGDRGAQLSGGQKQRIAIARALIRDPQILVLDEATSALDTQNEVVVQDALEKASRGRTTIVIAHRLSTIRSADRIFVVSHGKVIESGTHEQLFIYGGVYSNLATKQSQNLNAKDIEPSPAHDAADEISISNNLRKSFRVPKSVIEMRRASLKSSRSSITHVFRLGYFNWLFIILGLIGSIGFGVAFVLFNMIGCSLFIAIFTAPNADASAAVVTRNFIFYGFYACFFVSSTVLQLLFLGIAAARISRSLRYRAFSLLMRQDVSFFDDAMNTVGSLCLTLSLDVNHVKDAVAVHLGILVSIASQMVTLLIVMFAFSYKAGLVQLALMLLLILVTAGYRRLLQMRLETKAALLRVSNENLRQIVANIRTLIAFGLEKQFLDVSVNCHHTQKLSKRWLLVLYFLDAVIEGSIHISLFILGLASYDMFLDSDIDILVVIQFITVAFIMRRLSVSATAIPCFLTGLNSLHTVFEVIDLKQKQSGQIQLIPGLYQKNSDLINFKDVTFSYPSRKNAPILQGFSLNVRAGQMVALVGGSGSGKSTCIQLLERFYEPDSGSITVYGNKISSLTAGSLRRAMAVVLQEPLLFNRSVADNIAYGDVTRTVSMDEIVAAAIIANAHDFISELPQGYDTKVGERGLQISGGQKQRIAIARALIRKTKIVLLDEATSALDTGTEKEVQHSLQLHQNDTTFIIVAHRLSTIVNADLIVVVDKGSVVEIGSHADLMAKRGHYFRLQCQQAVDVAN